MPSLDTKFDMCNFAPKVRCTSKFSRHIFLYFVARNARTPYLFFVNILKDKPSQRKNAQLRASRSMYFYLLACQLKKFPPKMEKSECWVVRWSKRNEGFTDNKRGGRPKVLYKTAKIVLKKARYKRENPTR